jgi:hypothetical protein
MYGIVFMCGIKWNKNKIKNCPRVQTATGILKQAIARKKRKGY